MPRIIKNELEAIYAYSALSFFSSSTALEMKVRGAQKESYCQKDNRGYEYVEGRLAEQLKAEIEK